MTAQSDGHHLADVAVYVTAIYDGHWCMASVINVSTTEEEVHLNFHTDHRVHTSSLNAVTHFMFTSS